MTSDEIKQKHLDSYELRQKFLNFFEKKGHKIVPSSSLMPTDPSVLFTTAGMQQFKPYYLGEKSPYGLSVASCQKCIRTSDIDEVGDESHLTFFEMLGNFSFGGYFKKEAIELAYEFIVKELGLQIDYVTVFSPDKVPIDDWRKEVLSDKESFGVWKKYLPEEKIKWEGVDNFWGPTGEEGPCGPTTEIYVKGIEVWNIVFNEFFCDKSKKLKELDPAGVDTGMGLERLAMMVQGKNTIFETDLFESVIRKIEDLYGKKYEDHQEEFRIITDHIRSTSFMISDGILPSNKERGYILRRLMRRAIVNGYKLAPGFSNLYPLVNIIIGLYKDFYSELGVKEKEIHEIFENEEIKFTKTLKEGLKAIEKFQYLTGKEAFSIYETYGFPLEILEETHEVKDREDFFEELKKHQELSRTASVGMFKGGLADEKPETVRLHTAHHLLLAALQELFGKSVKQKGSNINAERLRMDFSFDRKLTDEEKKKIEDIVNEGIKARLNVVRREMPKEEAEKLGAEMEFGVKYGDRVSVYFIEDDRGNVSSKEFCGGPHVGNTSEIGHFKIIKEEAVGAGIRRIKATVD